MQQEARRSLLRQGDSCGNEASQKATIFVIDTLPPSIGIMAKDTMVNCTDTLSFSNWLNYYGFAQATDFCTVIDNSDTSVHWSVVDIDTTLACGNTGTYAVIFEVKDDCGNADSTMSYLYAY